MTNFLKKGVLVIIVFFMSSMMFAASINYHSRMKKGSYFESPISELYPLNPDSNTLNTEASNRDCSVKVNITLDDGTQISGEIVFVDVTWWECSKIKIGNFLSKIL